ncbi:ABC transporter permease [Oceanobacillus sp. CFH 90083]|uniref:ABC transporter permease n=1 Tax=Oceanobacillus sp. CFH 90083 TaxID=2592336 RepID=UPI00128BF51D|nr:ABC transporter permease [Oceanobacillus sp. CFH 90083]
MFKSYVPKPGRREYFTILLVGVEIIFFSLFADNFLTASNLTQIIQNSAELAIICIGMTLVIIAGGIDLSVGSILGVVAVIVGNAILLGLNPILIVFIAILSGLVLGFVNGAIVAWLRIPAIIVTLATMNIGKALVFMLLGGAWLTGLPPVFNGLTTYKILGLPVVFYIVLFMYAVFYYIFTYRPFGRHVYAVGTNPESAKLAGINHKMIQIATHSILGGLVGIAAVMYIARMGSVEMTVGHDLPLQVIAAVIIGGTAITGGRGSLVGTLAGVFFITIMKNGIVIMGIPSLWENSIIGTLILLSLTFDIVMQKRVEKKKLMTV